VKVIKIGVLLSIFFAASLYSMEDMDALFPNLEDPTNSIICEEPPPMEILSESLALNAIVYSHKINSGLSCAKRKGLPLKRECEICHKIIRGKANQAMEYHIRTHTQEKPYVCSENDYSSSQLGNCKRHAGTHALVQAFVIETFLENNKECIKFHTIASKKCSHCNQEFFNQYTRKKHQKSCKLQSHVIKKAKIEK
jgi:hypothetical protein